MKGFMKIRSVFLALFLLVPVDSQAANIKQGNMEVGGSTSYSTTTSSSYFRLSPTYQYFFMDHFSAGGTADLILGTGDYTYYSLGPTATWYVLAKDEFAPYIAVTPISWAKFRYTDAFYDTTVNVGLKYFLTDSVAVGPAVQWNHTYGRNGGNGRDTTTFLGTFAIHL